MGRTNAPDIQSTIASIISKISGVPLYLFNLIINTYKTVIFVNTVKIPTNNPNAETKKKLFLSPYFVADNNALVHRIC